MVDRKMVKAGDFLIGGPPANGAPLTKVMVMDPVEAVDEKFDEAQALQAAAAKVKAAIDALKAKAN